jgi:hypothetical protein
MSRCDQCGNDYDRSFDVVTADGSRRTFDSFECAIEAVAPRCARCECRIIGHGLEADGTIFCCAHCARQAGVQALRDRAPESVSGGS